MAIRTAPLYRGRGQKLTFEEKRALAGTIVEQLRIHGAVLTRTPPIHGHSRPTRRDSERK